MKEKTKQQILDQAFESIKELMVFETHPDEVARMYSAYQLISIRVGKEMFRIRKKQNDR